MGKAKNWIVNQALVAYLQHQDRNWLRAEAQRQSAKASKMKWKDTRLWEDAASEVWDDR